MKKSTKVIEWRKRSKRKAVESMGGKCQCCGYNTCNEALEFHHIDPSKKDFSFGRFRANPKKLSCLVEELKKCILLCSNCHKEIHAGVRKIPEAFQKLDETILVSEYELRSRMKQQRNIVQKIPIDRRKIFLSREEMKKLLEETFSDNKSALARYLGVSETAIRKHLCAI